MTPAHATQPSAGHPQHVVAASPETLPVPSSDAHVPAANLSVLTDLVGFDPQVVEEILQAFRTNALKSRELLHRHAAAGDFAPVAACAHALKAGARAIGAARLGDLCEQLEASAVGARAREVDTLLPQFDAELDTVLLYLTARQNPSAE